MRKSEKLKKIQLLLNQKNLYEDQYERLLAATGDWKSNYTDYLITEPIDLVEELKRVPEADYELCTALLTMLVKEEIPENASDKTFVDHKGLLILERMNEILSAGAREDESGRYTSDYWTFGKWFSIGSRKRETSIFDGWRYWSSADFGACKTA